MKYRLPLGILTPVTSHQYHIALPYLRGFLLFSRLPKHNLTLSIYQCNYLIKYTINKAPNIGFVEVGKTKQNKTKRNISSHPTYVRRVTFRSQGSKALRAYNQYYIFHCHLHSYCKWLVSKIITGCIRNLGFAISPLVLGGPRLSPSLTPAPLGVNDAVVADTSHTTADFFLLCPFFISLLLTVLRTAGENVYA